MGRQVDVGADFPITQEAVGDGPQYGYEYSEAELREWLPRLGELLAFSQRTVAFFNNHWKGKATRNAQLLKRLFEKEQP